VEKSQGSLNDDIIRVPYQFDGYCSCCRELVVTEEQKQNYLECLEGEIVCLKCAIITDDYGPICRCHMKKFATFEETMVLTLLYFQHKDSSFKPITKLSKDELRNALTGLEKRGFIEQEKVGLMTIRKVTVKGVQMLPFIIEAYRHGQAFIEFLNRRKKLAKA
jgi:hypothetical protein